MRAEPLLPWLTRAATSAIDANLDFLRTLFGGKPLDLFFVGTYDEMKSLGYDTHGGWTLTDEGTSFLIADDTLRAPNCGGFTPDDAAAVLARDGKLLSLDSLWQHFESRGDLGLQRYLQAASLVGYVDRTFGRDKLRTLWPIGAYRDIRQRLGIDLATLERGWHADIARRKAPRVSWDSLGAATKARGCERRSDWGRYSLCRGRRRCRSRIDQPLAHGFDAKV